MMAFYYLLCIGEYTVKGKCNITKQMVQFKFKDITFFKETKVGQLCCLPRNAPDVLILSVNSATLKLDNKKTCGRECLFTRKQMVMLSIAQSEHLGGVLCSYANMKYQNQLSYLHITMGERGLMSVGKIEARHSKWQQQYSNIQRQGVYQSNSLTLILSKLVMLTVWPSWASLTPTFNKKDAGVASHSRSTLGSSWHAI